MSNVSSIKLNISRVRGDEAQSSDVSRSVLLRKCAIPSPTFFLGEESFRSSKTEKYKEFRLSVFLRQHGSKPRLLQS